MVKFLLGFVAGFYVANPALFLSIVSTIRNVIE